MNLAVGAVGDELADDPTVTGKVLEAESPRSLVTVSVTMNVAADVNVCATVRPVPAAVPSPKVHEYDVIDVAPAPTVLADASKVTGTPVRTGVGDMLNEAVGAPAGAWITPGGTSRMSTLNGIEAGPAVGLETCALAPIGLTMICTKVLDPPTEGGGAGAR